MSIFFKTVRSAFKLHGRIDREVEERRRGPKADGPHDVECVGCGKPYRCFCDRQHEQGECHYCHNNTTEKASAAVSITAINRDKARSTRRAASHRRKRDESKQTMT
jgi:hypothetical protein